jgi:diguanylate cyclase (GGDEF)-like protein
MRARASTDAASAAHIVIDLDDFKPVNDAHGHAVGDQLLRLATQRMASVMRREDQIVRLGGDEFLVLVPGANLELAIGAVLRLLGVFAEPFAIGTLSLRVGASIGVAGHDPQASFEVLTERADMAMYAAKQKGKNQWAVWDPLEGVWLGASDG